MVWFIVDFHIAIDDLQNSYIVEIICHITIYF